MNVDNLKPISHFKIASSSACRSSTADDLICCKTQSKFSLAIFCVVFFFQVFKIVAVFMMYDSL